MSDTTTLLNPAPSVPVRDHFAPIKVVFLIGIHVGAAAAFWHSTWAAVEVCLLMHAACGGLGICVGYHRLLTHRSFKCPRAVEFTDRLPRAGTGKIDWRGLQESIRARDAAASARDAMKVTA